MESTIAIIKPDAVLNGDSGQIIHLIELNGFTIVNMLKVQLAQEDAEAFYAVHNERPFFGELVSYMTSGPVIIMELAKENAIQEWRELMGATNPAQAKPGTIRRMFGIDIGTNAVHGSDSAATAEQEIDFFFGECEEEECC